MPAEPVDPFVIPVGRRALVPADGYHWFGYEESLSIGVRFSSEGILFLKVNIGSKSIWGDGIAVNRAELIRFFGENWGALWLESFPDNLEVQTVGQWWPAARKIYRAISLPTLRERFEHVWRKFRLRHCLSASFLAIDTVVVWPEIWLVSSGRDMILDVPALNIHKAVPLGATMNTLERACNFLSAGIGTNQSKTSLEDAQALKIWRTREEARSATELTALYAGLEEPRLLDRILPATGKLNISDVISHQSETLAAARMRPGGVSNDDLELIFMGIEEVPRISTPTLDALSEEAVKHLSPVLQAGEPPFEQGYQLALWVRDRLGLSYTDLLNPYELLSNWGVKVKTVTLGTIAIDALAFWGPRHGPAVILNSRGAHTIARAGRRATLAHEICHLIFDRQRELPLIDVVGGHVPESIEQRARAFAAELLLPQRAAYESFLKTDQSLHELSNEVALLMRQFRVSKWVASYQLKHALRRFLHRAGNLTNILAYLDAVTSIDDGLWQN